MGLYSIEKLSNNSILGIWKKEESIEYLLNKVNIYEEERENFERYTNESRKKEWLSTRLLLSKLITTNSPIQYEATGKPWLKDSEYKISLSHSRNFIAIILAKHSEPGIDIEHIAERVLKVKHKFLSDKELIWCTRLEQYTLCWSAKEAIFKTVGEGIDFKDILIQKFNLEKNGYFNATIISNGDELYCVNYKIIENDVLTFTFRERKL